MYLSTIVGGAVLFGVLINEFIPREWITGAIPIQFHGEMHEHPAGWLQWVSSGLLLILIMNGYLQKYLSVRRGKQIDLNKEEGMKSNQYTYSPDLHVFNVEGMTCKHCKASVENGLGQMDVVTEVLADPDQNRVTIQASGLSDELVKETIEKLGYQFGGRI